MALRPDSEDNRDNKLAVRKAAEEEVLLREVDEALRQDQIGSFAKRYGWPIGIAPTLPSVLWRNSMPVTSSRRGTCRRQAPKPL